MSLRRLSTLAHGFLSKLALSHTWAISPSWPEATGDSDWSVAEWRHQRLRPSRPIGRHASFRRWHVCSYFEIRSSRYSGFVVTNNGTPFKRTWNRMPLCGRWCVCIYSCTRPVITGGNILAILTFVTGCTYTCHNSHHGTQSFHHSRMATYR